jgi:D-amino peptidase
MKIYVAVDMEGISGITSPDQCTKGNALYDEGRKLMAGDVNAVVEGALAGGAEEIIVADLHDGSNNISPFDLHPKAKLMSGVPFTFALLPCLDDSFDGVFFVGFHAKAGTLHAICEHTVNSSSWFKLVVNGEEMGEVGFCAALAGERGVPVLLVAGDDKVCAEARKLLGPIETGQVKIGLGRHRGLCLSPEESANVLKEAAQKALRLKDKVKPFTLGSPVEVRLTYKHTHLADAAQIDHPQAERVDGYTLALRVERLSDWFGNWRKLP